MDPCGLLSRGRTAQGAQEPCDDGSEQENMNHEIQKNTEYVILGVCNIGLPLISYIIDGRKIVLVNVWLGMWWV